MLGFASLDEAFNDMYSKKKKKKDTQKRETFTTKETATPYSGAQSDMNYACRNFGICPPAYTPSTTSQPTGNRTGPLIEGFDPNSDSCQPLQMPQPGDHAYAEVIREQMESMNKMMALTQSDLQPDAYKPHMATSVPMEMDEELQEYLNSASESITESTVTSSPATPSSLSPAPLEESSDSKSSQSQPQSIQQCPSPCPPCPSPIPPVDPKKKWMDLSLFIFIGILFIFLLEQLVRIGIMIGMKQTTAFLAPFAEYAQALAKQSAL